MGEDAKERLLKIVVCGDGASGKTSLCLRLSNDVFDPDYHQTLGLDFFSRRIVLPGDVSVMMQVWDVGGQSIASSMIDKYVFGADAVLVVYDITNTASFDNVQEWVSTVKKLLRNSEKMPQMALVGNKTDLEMRRAVRIDRHTAMASENDMHPYHASARTGDSVLLLFRQVAASVLNIPLAKSDVEKDIVPLPAEATQAIDQPKRRPQQNATAVCTIM